MSVVLMLYAEEVFYKHVLPSISNADDFITLNRKLFSLDDNIEIGLEVGDREWSFVQSKEYIVRKGEEVYFNKVIANGDILEVEIRGQKSINIIVIETDTLFGVYEKFDISTKNEISIGKSPTNMICYETQNYVSRNHARLVREGKEVLIEDLSANGIFVNSIRVKEKQKLNYADSIDIFGLHLVYLGDLIAISSIGGRVIVNPQSLSEYAQQESTVLMARSDKKKKVYFNRSPRNVLKIFSDPIEIEGPPAAKRTKDRPLIYTIGPSFTMAIPMLLGCMISVVAMRSSGGNSSAFMYTGLVTAFGSAVIGVIWAMVNLRYAKKDEKEEEELRFNAYGNYLLKMTDFIREKYEHNSKVLLEAYPDTKVCLTYGEKESALWNRNYTHDDFLFVRLGLGSIPFHAQINFPKVRFQLIEDKLMEKPETISENYKTLYHVPVGVNLMKHRLLGIVGGENRTGCIKAMHIMAAQIAANNCYTDVKMVFLYDRKNEDEKMWEFAQWLPHVWSADYKTRYVASNQLEASDVFYELANILRLRMENTNTYSTKKVVKPHYVIFVGDVQMLMGEPIAKYLLDPKEEYGISTLLFAEKDEQLPNACEDILNVKDEKTVIYNALERRGDEDEIELDQAGYKELDELARRLANIKVSEMESSSDIPPSLDFFEMYGISVLKELNVMERWRKNRTYDSMKALIGKKQGGADCYLDIHEKYHGPHGLIAGTTGSGKSETLQTYMLSLAINFSPDDIGFFIIDFKGGGMANLFSDLPHMIGQISNLSGNQVHRAMVSIKSENMRRQRIFNEHGVNNINLYTRLLKNNEAKIPVPHLFIIIDEFAELKREEPDFMRELISVAQVGRSLGVHLILATQKPSGTVDDNIWANTKFRLCLRVQDRQDSNDMLHKPDAAYITQAGRCYLQVGNDEIYELFQSGWSGAVYDEDAAQIHTDIATMLTLTGKTAIVGSKTKIKQKEAARTKWLMLLTKVLVNASKRLGYKLGDCIDSAEKRNQLLKDTFTQLAMAKVDFPDNPYNRIRLEEFVQMLTEENLDSSNEMDQESMKLLIQQASEHGKKLPELKEKTQLDAVVEYLKSLAEENGYTHNLQLWLPVLPQKLYLEELFGYKDCCFNNNKWPQINKKWTLEAYVGLCDDPENQAQNPVVVNLAENGHTAICGTVVSGKSTFLQTLIYSLMNRYNPEYVNFYILDFSSHMLGAYEDAAHVGGVMYENDEDKIRKFFCMVGKMLNDRKNLLQGGNYSQYVQVHGVTIPSVIIAIDNYSNFREKTDNEFEDILIQLSRDGAGYGIFLVITSAGFGSSEIQSRIGDNIRTVICLEMGDKFKYGDAMRTMHFNVLPEADVKGRGLVSMEGNILEFQTALTMEAEDDYQRGERIREQCSIWNASWNGKTARKVPEIPEHPVLSEFVELEDYQQIIEEGDKLPVGYNMEDASCYSIPLSETYCYQISGRARTGKTNVLKMLIHAASNLGADLCIVDDSNKQLSKIATEVEASYITTDQELFDYWKEMMPVFIERNKKKHQYVEDGMEDEEIFKKMRETKPVIIFIADLVTYMKSIYTPEKGVGGMSGFMENILEKGSLHNIYLFGCANPEDVSTLSGYRAYNIFTDYKKGMHLGGNVAAQRLFNFNNIPYMEQSKVMKPGIALTPSTEDESIAMKVVIPLARG
ncbi:type VII secretion protein EssC [Anaerosporobacter sp.]